MNKHICKYCNNKMYNLTYTHRNLAIETYYRCINCGSIYIEYSGREAYAFENRWSSTKMADRLDKKDFEITG